jgi:hypothetical protein
MRPYLYLVFVFWLLVGAHCVASQVQITVADARGQPLKNALVIVQDLNHKEHELFRTLTDDAGAIAPHELAPGLYRAIGTYPYSHWRTSIREFLVRDTPVKVELQMEAAEGLDDLPVSIGTLTVHVQDANGQPAAGARVLVRDAEAHPSSEHWGTTNAQGTTTLDLSDTPSTLVVVYRDQLFTFPTDAWDTERTLRLQ